MVFFFKKKKLIIIVSELTNNPDSNIIWYLLLLAVDKFYENEGYHPGEDLNKDMDPDVKKLTHYFDVILKEYGISSVKDAIPNLNNYITEM